MSRKLTLAFILGFILLSVLVSVFKVQKVKASGTICIKADGSIDPPYAPISSVDNVTYTFTGNINDSIVVERDNIVVDGAGYTVQGTGSGNGIDLTERSNVTIKNTNIKGFDTGVYVYRASNNTIFDNNITNNNWYGIKLTKSSNNTISENNITENYGGINLWGVSSKHNTISENKITSNGRGDGIGIKNANNNIVSGNNITGNRDYGIRLYTSSNNILRSNSMSNNTYNFMVWSKWLSDYLNDVDVSNTVDGKPVYYWINKRDMIVPSDAGFVALVNCTNIIVQNLNLSKNHGGILLFLTTTSTITKNNLIDNYSGIALQRSSNNSIYRNNIANNKWGIELGTFSNHTIIYHNNFKDNTEQVNIEYSTNFWDNGSEGNYWSDYTDRYPDAKELDDSGIWDTPYAIDGNNQDNYPLMNPFNLPFPSIEVVEIKSEPWNLLNVPFKDADEATKYIEDFELSPFPEDFGEIPVTVTIANTGDSSATGVSIDARMTGDVLMVVLDPADIRDDTAVSYQFDYTESVFTGGTIGMGDEITEKLILPIKYCSLVVGAILLLDNMNVMMPLEIVVPIISVHVTLTIKGNFDDVEYEIPEDILGIGDPADLLKEWNYQLSRRVQEKEIQVLLETYYSHVLDLKLPAIDIDPNIPTGIYETPVNILPGTSKIVLTLVIPAGITLVGLALLPWGATTPIGATLIATGLAMIVLNNPPSGEGTIEIVTASPELNMTLIVVQLIPENVQTIDHIAVEDGQIFHVITVSNSTLTDFDFSKEEKRITFNIKSPSENHSFCHVTTPENLLRDNATHPWKVKLNGSDISFTLTENETHSFHYFKVIDSGTCTIEIMGAEVIPEFPSFLILPLFMMATLLAVIVYRRKYSIAHSFN